MVKLADGILERIQLVAAFLLDLLGVLLKLLQPELARNQLTLQIAIPELCDSSA